eukprot:TRINITY_DN2770_c0_g1_i1.p1 TRINITY_DN2770_c0_g1~~TRINITY_DN2770_c0_g1_i1.p1  ORF type:complete len:468 (+),score=108.55 TRINITY_DN2770_c0_g1_i1:189-1592(+)
MSGANPLRLQTQLLKINRIDEEGSILKLVIMEIVKISTMCCTDPNNGTLRNSIDELLKRLGSIAKSIGGLAEELDSYYQETAEISFIAALNEKQTQLEMKRNTLSMNSRTNIRVDPKNSKSKPTLASVPKEVEEELDPLTKEAIETFNNSFNKGLMFIYEKNIVERGNDLGIAKFLMKYNNKVSKEQLGELLSRQQAKDLLAQFTSLLDFAGETFDASLRKFLSKFMLVGEAQVIDRTMEIFSNHFCKCNAGLFPTPDAAFILAFAIIMLNTDLHNPAIKDKEKMTREGFVKLTAGTWSGNDPPKEMINQLYDSISNDEIIMKAKGDPDKKGWVKSIKGGSYEQGRRWVLLVGNELSWYKEPTMGKGEKPVLGKVVLDNMMIKTVSDKMIISAIIPKPIGFYVFDSKKKADEVQCNELVITCENDMRVETWATALRNNLTFENLELLLNKENIKVKATKVTRKQNKY